MSSLEPSQKTIDAYPELLPREPEADPPAPFLTFRGAPEQQVKLMAAIAAARLEFGAVVRDRTGQYGNQRFPYATLGSLTEATGRALAKQGVTVMNIFTTSPTDPQKHRLTTWVMGHGATIEACLDFLPREAREDGKGGGEFIKELGKLQTYLIRYQYRALFTLDSEPDADEAGETVPERQPQPRREAPRPPAQAKQERPQNTVPAPAAPPPAAPAAPLTRFSRPPENEPAPPAPENPVPPVTETKDDLPSEMVHNNILTLAKNLGLNAISFSDVCMKATGLPPKEAKQSAPASQALLERLQAMFLDRQAQGTLQ